MDVAEGCTGGEEELTSEFEGYQARDPNDGIIVDQEKIQGFVKLCIHTTVRQVRDEAWPVLAAASRQWFIVLQYRCAISGDHELICRRYSNCC